MWEHRLHEDEGARDRWASSPLTWAAGAWVVGLLVGREMHGSLQWILGSVFAIACGFVFLMAQRARIARALLMISIVFLGLGWWNLRLGDAGVWGLEAEPVGRLVCVEGI